MRPDSRAGAKGIRPHWLDSHPLGLSTGFPPAGTLDQTAFSAFVAQRAIAQRVRLGEHVLTAFTTHTAQVHASLLTLRPQESETLCYHPVRLMPTQVLPPLWLSELVIHAWDIRSALDPAASLEAVSFPILVERLP